MGCQVSHRTASRCSTQMVSAVSKLCLPFAFPRSRIVPLPLQVPLVSPDSKVPVELVPRTVPHRAVDVIHAALTACPGAGTLPDSILSDRRRGRCDCPEVSLAHVSCGTELCRLTAGFAYCFRRCGFAQVSPWSAVWSSMTLCMGTVRCDAPVEYTRGSTEVGEVTICAPSGLGRDAAS